MNRLLHLVLTNKWQSCHKQPVCVSECVDLSENIFGVKASHVSSCEGF